MKWFGESWGAPACEFGERVATPVGHGCDVDLGGCGRPIEADDQGVLLPYSPDGVQVRAGAFHLDCWLRFIGGPCRAHGVLGCDGSGSGRVVAVAPAAAVVHGEAWVMRECDGCGSPVAARSVDPTVRVLCTVCHPGGLPLSVREGL